MPKRLHGNIEIDLRRFGLPTQSGPVHVAFDNAGRPLRARPRCAVEHANRARAWVS